MIDISHSSTFSSDRSAYFDLWLMQLAKLAGNTVVATCGGKEKAMLLKDLGVDRVIDYKAEDIKTVSSNFSNITLILARISENSSSTVCLWAF